MTLKEHLRQLANVSFKSMSYRRMKCVCCLLASLSYVGWAENAAETGHVEFKGFAGRKASALLEGRVFSRYAREDVMDEAVRAFETHYDDTHKPGSGYWQGEFWGKTMLGHVGAYRYTGRADVRDYVLRQVDRLVGGYMDKDGYLGTYKNPRFIKGGWNLWGRKYTLWALIEAYEATGERRVLDAATKTADQFIGMISDMKILLRETGCFNGLASCSVLFPLMRLYVHVQKPSYLEFAKSMVAEWDRADNATPNLIANAFSGKPVHSWYPKPIIWAKSYEMMSCYEGLVEYSMLTGERRPLEAATMFADLLEQHEANAIGCVGYYDHFTHAAANHNATIEMCDVVYWMRLCHALYRATGETRHLDRAEKAFLNSFLAGLYTCGHWGAYSVRAHGYRHGTSGMAVGMRHHSCCVDNSPRGFYDFADHAVCLRGKVLEVNHYLSCAGKVGGGVEVKVSGDYPVSEDVRVEVTSPRPIKVAFRVPGWCGEMAVDGRSVSAEQGRVAMDAAAGRTSFALHFSMPATIVHRPEIGGPALAAEYEQDAKGNDGALLLFELPNRFPEMLGMGLRRNAAYIMRGPLVLAKASGLDIVEKEVFSGDTVNGDKAWKATVSPIDRPGFWGAWELTLEKGTERRVTPVCDFPSAAPSDDWHNSFSIWF